MNTQNLTHYDLSCGKIQVIKTKYAKVELYKEHNIYNVRRFSKFIDGRLIKETWLQFEKLKDAKKCFKRQVDIMKGQ